jgi:glutathione S-transferase
VEAAELTRTPGVLTVYAIPQSLYCAKLRIALRHKGLAWREVAPPGGYGSAEYKEIVPSGNLPALVDGDLLLADSEAIAEYLEETRPEPAMLPEGAAARARVRELSRFHDTRLEPELRRLFPHIAPDHRDAALAARQSAAITMRLGHLARMLEARDSPSMLTLADCGYPITFAWIDRLAPVLGLAVTWPAGVTAYRERVMGYPAVTAELASYGPVLAAWLRSKDTAP